ncbi:hypothetical protein Dvina_20045 [Dactylosporangium vinaceum]|uniref:Uncharacterized protein n=1 Tax=Dactylosporangium vinaceum TaxID=53362 RepID=A0ABV5MSK7_9ACTN|nr:hypothetical protein [Dactylosporangium vinaceum]UAC00147.1 hypothetical protein Dvina_20045 [Dactylosporangium vinaceum]
MAVSYGLLSTHPPTRCGLAAFNAALARQQTAAPRAGGIVRVTASGDDPHLGAAVVHTWPAGSVAGWLGAAAALNAFDVAVVQHEFGIYPGPAPARWPAVAAQYEALAAGLLAAPPDDQALVARPARSRT